MKKIVIGVVALVAIIVGIYLSSTPKIAGDIKATVHQEMEALNQHGFGIKKESLAEDKDKFTIVFDDMRKIRDYLSSLSTEVSLQSIEPLKGMEVTAEIAYSQGITNAISVQMYPSVLPNQLLDEVSEKELALLNDMIEKRIITINFEVDKTLSGFKGNINDIDYTITNEDDENIKFVLTNSNFQGTLKKEKVESMTHATDLVKIEGGGAAFEIKSINLDGKKTGSSPYDSAQKGQIKEISFQDKLGSAGKINVKNITYKTSSSAKGNLLNADLDISMDNIEIYEMDNRIEISDINFDINMKNVSIDAMNAINSMDSTLRSEQDKVIFDALKDLVSSNFSMDINNLSIKEIRDNDETYKGFKANANLYIDKDTDIDLIFSQNKFDELFFFDLKLTFSNEILDLLSSDPSFGMMLMMFPPKEDGNELIYEIKRDKGLTINGQKLL